MRLQEFSHTPRKITDILVKKGYTFLASGVDQTAFLEPGTGLVLKIFGTQRGTKANKLTPDQKMFGFWTKYCSKHPDNPFLPKFSGWETFVFEGNTYLQIRMERLQKLPEYTARILAALASDNVSFNHPFLRNVQAAGEREVQKKKERRDAGIGNHAIGNLPAKPKHPLSLIQDAHNELVILLGEQHYNLLLDTLADLYEISRKKGWTYDLHPGNFMHRNDGMPIIVDPWVIEGSSW